MESRGLDLADGLSLATGFDTLIVASADPPELRRVRAALDGLRASASEESGVLLLIDGSSGTGKSTLARAVLGGLPQHVPAQLVAVDEHCRAWDGLPAAVDAVRHDLVEPWSQGRAARLPRYDWVRHQWTGGVDLAPGGLLVVEGCGAALTLPTGPVGSASPAALRAPTLLVRCELPDPVRRGRALRREPDFAARWGFWDREHERLAQHRAASGV